MKNILSKISMLIGSLILIILEVLDVFYLVLSLLNSDVTNYFVNNLDSFKYLATIICIFIVWIFSLLSIIFAIKRLVNGNGFRKLLFFLIISFLFLICSLVLVVFYYSNIINMYPSIIISLYTCYFVSYTLIGIGTIFNIR